jgi:predicted molibdopterin-dependent oxidoreductase YjgC
VAGLATTLGSGAMTNSIRDIPQADVLLVTGSNTTEAHPVLALQMKKAVRQHGAKLILIDPREIELAEFAYLHLRQKPGTDVALLNAMAYTIIAHGWVNERFIAERTEGYDALKDSLADWTPERAAVITGVRARDIVAAARLYAEATNGAIFWAMGITQHTHGTDNVKALSNLALLTGHIGRPGTGLNPLRGQNNVQGACDMGGLVNVYPGYQPVTSEEARQKFAAGWGVPLESLSPKVGLTITEVMNGVLDGRIHALYIMGENPMLSDPNLHHVEKALRAVDFLVVQDIFLNETAELAHIVLPAASFAEKEGTFTSTERRVQMVRPAFPPPGEARQDWQIISELANRLGHNWQYSSPADIFAEMATLTPQYRRHEPRTAATSWAAMALPNAGTSRYAHLAQPPIHPRPGSVLPGGIPAAGGSSRCGVSLHPFHRAHFIPLARWHHVPPLARVGCHRPRSGGRNQSGRWANIGHC